ncbi:hypothetical protein Aros01_02663 [Streptosporangium roseum]|uniref:Uncharacterized protein n=1 Tax=Streptosporangium roseum (strain ATCC 12428 / DSM 43021 / JCM 3005 / KCTC 9067 / NCIMB 10171 / NRRL 2505 / NI 9100) TaxID=479432 RepID=D2AXN3_STRRD|nr:hypothetical protein Sros_0159 [Streptosporangium roseum DSM 43021]
MGNRMGRRRRADRQIVTGDTEISHALFEKIQTIVGRLNPGEDFLQYARRRDSILRDKVMTISNLVAPYDAFDVIDLMRQREMPLILDGYRESLDEGRAAAIEIVALILLARGRREGGSPNLADAPNSIIQELHHHTLEMLDVGTFALLAEGTESSHGPLAPLAADYRSSELNIRNKQYAHIHDRFNEALFGSPVCGSLILDALGFTYEEFIAVRESIRDIYVDGITSNLDALGEVAMNWNGGKDGYEQNAEEIETGRAAATSIFFFPGNRASTNPEAVSQKSGVGIDQVRAILRLFSVSFESADPVHSVQEFFDGKNVFSRAALICDGADNFLTLSSPIGNDCFRHVAEDALKPSPAWNKYDRLRTRVSEGLATDYLQSLLDCEASYTQLKYFRPKKGVETAALGAAAVGLTELADEAEADALFLIEDVAICVEVKGRSVSERAKLGMVKRLATDLEVTVGEAASQAHRLEELITTNGGIWISKDQWLALDHISEVRSIAICLDDMGPLAVALDQLVRSGILQTKKLPWIVSLHDLAVIAETLDRPSEFLLYLRRRSDSDISKHYIAVDELDMFMLFLAGGLYIEPDPELVYKLHPTAGKPTGAARARYRAQAIPTRVGTHTDELDAWIYYQEGASTTEQTKPRFRSNDDVLRIVDFLADGHKPGWLRFGADLLNLSSEAQENLSTGMLKTIRQTQIDHQRHSLAQGYAGAWGFPSLFICSQPIGSSQNDCLQWMSTYMVAKKHQLQSDRCLGLLMLERGDISAVRYDNSPVRQSAELDQLVVDMQLQPLDRIGRTIPPSARRAKKQLRGSRGKG